ncbi:MAG: hypothetical protein WBM06_14520, partial [Pseudolabrys sp.]
DGAAGPAVGGGIGSLAPGLDGGGEVCATAGPAEEANAKVMTIRASLMGDITVLRRLRRSGDSPALLHILAWPLVNPCLFAI